MTGRRTPLYTSLKTPVSESLLSKACKVTGLLPASKALAQVFSSEFCEISNSLPILEADVCKNRCSLKFRIIQRKIPVVESLLSKVTGSQPAKSVKVKLSYLMSVKNTIVTCSKYANSLK